jgi:hypothetical protein
MKRTTFLLALALAAILALTGCAENETAETEANQPAPGQAESTSTPETIITPAITPSDEIKFTSWVGDKTIGNFTRGRTETLGTFVTHQRLFYKMTGTEQGQWVEFSVECGDYRGSFYVGSVQCYGDISIKLEYYENWERLRSYQTWYVHVPEMTISTSGFATEGLVDMITDIMEGYSLLADEITEETFFEFLGIQTWLDNEIASVYNITVTDIGIELDYGSDGSTAFSEQCELIGEGKRITLDGVSDISEIISFYDMNKDRLSVEEIDW